MIELVVLEELDAAQARHVEQHAAADHAVGHRHHRVRARAVAAHLGRRPPAVHLAAHEHVRERVDVGDAEAVHVGADVVARRFVARECRCCRARRPPPACGGAPGYGFSGDGAVARLRARLIVSPSRTSAAASSAVLGGQVMQRAAFVVVRPTGPSSRARRTAHRDPASRDPPPWGEASPRQPRVCANLGAGEERSHDRANAERPYRRCAAGKGGRRRQQVPPRE